MSGRTFVSLALASLAGACASSHGRPRPQNEGAPPVMARPDAPNIEPCAPLKIAFRARTERVRSCSIEAVDTTASYEARYAPIETASKTVTRARVYVNEAPELRAAVDALVPDPLTRAPASQRQNALSIMARYYVTGPHEVRYGAGGLTVAPPPPIAFGCPDCPRWDEVPAPIVAMAAHRARALALPVVGWPGARAVAQLRTTGEEVVALERPVAEFIDLEWRGRPLKAASTITLRQVERGSGGDVTVFDVGVSVASQDESSCSLWKSEGRLVGELSLRASDGAFLALRVRGPIVDFETPCPGDEQESGGRAGAETCDAGELSFEAQWGRCRRPERRETIGN